MYSGKPDYNREFIDDERIEGFEGKLRHEGELTGEVQVVVLTAVTGGLIQDMFEERCNERGCLGQKRL